MLGDVVDDVDDRDLVAHAGCADLAFHDAACEALRADDQYGEAIAAYRHAITLRAEAAHAFFGLSMAQLASSDLLNEYITHTGSAVFACPPGVGAGDYWGSTLFG